MENIDAFRINFEQDQLILLNVCLAFIMFGIALDLSASDFRRLLQQPKAAIVGLSSQLILLPIFTFILILIWPMPASFAMGLILIAACPGGNISNFAVHLGNGNTALSISLTSVVTMAAVIITPFTFRFWTGMVKGTSELMQGISVSSLEMLGIIGQLILVPLIVGMSLKRMLPAVANRIKKPIRFVSLLMFTAFILFALIQNRENLLIYLKLVFIIVLVHNGLALAIGYYYSRSWKLSIPDSRAISMETGIQNAGLGLVLIFNFFDDVGGMMIIAAWWGIWDLISSFLLSLYWRYFTSAVDEKQLIDPVQQITGS